MSNKIEPLYNQCLVAYEKYRNNNPMIINDGYIMPSPLDDEYNVPAEFLFNELSENNKKQHIDRQEFDIRLIKWLSKRKKWDSVEFLKKEDNVGKIALKNMKHIWKFFIDVKVTG